MLSFLTPPPHPPSFAYGLFISHAWDYALAYEGVVRLLNADINLKWKNLSIPIENPIRMLPLLPKSNRTILKELEERIKESDALLVLAGMYFAHSGWIQSEIEIARDFGKPIIGVKPRGQERIPAALQSFACELVGWTTESMVRAIRNYAKPSNRVVAPIGIPTPSGLSTLRAIAALTPPQSRAIPTMAAPSTPMLTALAAMMSGPTNTVPSGFTGSNAESISIAAFLRGMSENK
jgi:hypothetical protein